MGAVRGAVWTFLLLTALATPFAAADDPPPAEIPDQPAPPPSPPAARARRPRIGLALGGGGARGGAHVGVLKVLERMHVPVDYVAGTSMGAVVGGLYASGVPPAQIEKELRAIDWSDILADKTPYHDLVWRRKEDEGRYLADIEIGFRDGRFRFPTGLRAGQKLGFELQRYLLPVTQTKDFDQLPVPFRAVATDIETGERVVLARGDLSEAILASMTIPGAFTPVPIEGRLLVDGGMADNLPVEVVRAMGADIVIAVDVGTPLSSQEEIQSILGVTGQALTFLTRKNAERSAALADLVITPELSGISTGTFTSVSEAIDRGEAAALAQEPALAPLAVPPAEWESHAPSGRTPETFTGVIREVRVEGNERVDARIIENRARIPEGEPLDLAKVGLGLRRVYGMDLFQTVRFGLVPDGDATDLVLRVKEKPWGPTFFHFGLDVVDDFEGGAEYGVKANMTVTSLNALGAEWRTDLELGSRPGVRTEYFQPLDFAGRFFVAPWAWAQRSVHAIFNDDGDKFASYRVDVHHAQLDGGIEYGRFGELRVGLYRNRVHAKVDTGDADLPRFDVSGGGIALSAALDTLDRPAIPHRGTQAQVTGLFSRESLGAEDSYDKLDAGFVTFWGFGRHTLFAGASGGTNLGSTLPVYEEFLLGGLFSLGGYSTGELRGQLYGSAITGYHYRIGSMPSALGQGIYLGALTETGNVWESSDEVSLSDLHYSGTVILGADTLLGPFFLAYGHAEGGRSRVYLTIGLKL